MLPELQIVAIQRAEIKSKPCSNGEKITKKTSAFRATTETATQTRKTWKLEKRLVTALNILYFRADQAKNCLCSGYLSKRHLTAQAWKIRRQLKQQNNKLLGDQPKLEVSFYDYKPPRQII